MSFDVEVEPYDGIDVIGITREELEKQAIRTRNTWQDNLEAGEGANGSHGGPYVNTGEAVNDVTWEFTGELEVVVGGDVVQLAVAEFGRAPSPGSPPPFEHIADWAREKGLTPEEGSFEDMVEAIRWAIAENGLDGFAPAAAAANEQRGELPDRLRARIDEKLDEQAN